ncbi:uncharacterized protein EMH_0018550 [Eimeria mitis]|uniref:Uncharacterized protein n=1 Tax=Eimeria mitis TaxID=44415 RepID=U6KB93_9EIME|nr:uncharacterized protein EMH_0018550 [Eimeria mitis]CDJ34066.1 hypothetical protein EMH_0018550 [Eimeria mitis]
MPGVLLGIGPLDGGACGAPGHWAGDGDGYGEGLGLGAGCAGGGGGCGALGGGTSIRLPLVAGGTPLVDGGTGAGAVVECVGGATGSGGTSIRLPRCGGAPGGWLGVHLENELVDLSRVDAHMEDKVVGHEVVGRGRASGVPGRWLEGGWGAGEGTPSDRRLDADERGAEPGL